MVEALPVSPRRATLSPPPGAIGRAFASPVVALEPPAGAARGPGPETPAVALKLAFVAAPAHEYTRALRDAVPEIGRPLRVAEGVA